MENVSKIVMSTSIEQIKFYMDYTEMLLVEFEKRDLDQEELLHDLDILTNRFKELQKE